jgi:peptide/nickel transport system substrate-binding protein
MITPMDPTVLGYPAESAGRATYFQYCCLERLIIYAPDVWQNQDYQPILATSYTFENDMKTWTFQLREGVTFHDGTPWNADAVKWEFELLKEAGNSTTFNSMESCVVLDPYTVQVNFASPANTFEVELATGVYFISPTAFENAGTTEEERVEWARGHPVGTGPFKFVEAVLGDHVTFERYDDYWAGKPYLEGIRYIIVPDATTSKNMMIAGEADMYVFSEFKETLELEAMDGYYARYCKHHTPEGIWPSALDPDSYMYDLRVREAIEYAIDREAIVAAISLGSDEIEIMYQAPIPGDPAYRPDFGRHYDLQKAKDLMEEAGLENGFETTIYVRSITGRWSDMALMVQSMLAEINITVNIELVNPGEYMTLLLFGWPPDTLFISGIPNEPISNFVAARDYACTPAGVPKWNASTVQTPEMCELWAELKAATSPEATRAAYVRLSNQAMDDAVGIYMMDWPDTAVFCDYVMDCDWIAYSTKVWNANTTWMAAH